MKIIFLLLALTVTVHAKDLYRCDNNIITDNPREYNTGCKPINSVKSSEFKQNKKIQKSPTTHDDNYTWDGNLENIRHDKKASEFSVAANGADIYSKRCKKTNDRQICQRARKYLLNGWDILFEYEDNTPLQEALERLHGSTRKAINIIDSFNAAIKRMDD